MPSRAQNERKFKSWEDLPNGGRRYFRDFVGRAGGRARYIKEVDASEVTVRFAQEIYVQPVASSPSTRSFPSIWGTNCCKIAKQMKITRQIIADKIADYLHGKISQAELVDWAERAMMGAAFDEADVDLLTDIVGRLGLADVAEFGLRWQDCEEFLRRLGYRAKVIVSTE